MLGNQLGDGRCAWVRNSPARESWQPNCVVQWGSRQTHGATEIELKFNKTLVLVTLATFQVLGNPMELSGYDTCMESYPPHRKFCWTPLMRPWLPKVWCWVPAQVGPGARRASWVVWPVEWPRAPHLQGSCTRCNALSLPSWNCS